MKIACQSCQAKYTIADEKVVGKVVKIRCKKCGATIVVNGQEGGQGVAAEEPTEVRGSSADLAGQGGDAEGWTVNVGDNDQRTMTTQQIVAEFSGGVITDETYCWRDGMGDWLPLREIEELATACGLNAASSFAKQSQAAAAPRAAGSSPQAAGASGGALAGIFGSSPPPANAGGGAAAARRTGARASGADLFGGAAEAGGENDVMTSAPTNSAGARGAVVNDDKMTGQRNENSVLFSLNALTANEPKKGAEKMAGAAEGDGSGLIDIRALSSSMGSSGGGPKKPSHADDIMNLGGGGAFSAALAAPVLTAPPLDAADPNAPGGASSSNTKMMIGFGAITLLLLVGMVGMYFALKPPPATAVATAPDTTAGAGTAAAPGSAAAAATAAAPTASAAPEPVAESTPKAAPPSVGGGRRSTGGGGGGGGGTASFVPSTPPPPPPSGPADSLAAQMAKAVPHSETPSGGGGGGGGGGGSANPFDRGAAAAALGAIADGAASCKKPGGPTGDGHVSITFSPGGSVVSAIVDQPPFAGTAVGGCVAGKFRGAHVPAFAGGNLTIGKRFSIN